MKFVELCYVFFPVNIAIFDMHINGLNGTSLPPTPVEGGRRNMTCFESQYGRNKQWRLDLYDIYRITYIEITVPDSNGLQTRRSHSRPPLTRTRPHALHGCTAARLHGCTAARLHGCTAARLHGCTAARLHGCTAARLHGCTAARLHGCTAAKNARMHARCIASTGEIKSDSRMWHILIDNSI